MVASYTVCMPKYVHIIAITPRLLVRRYISCYCSITGHEKPKKLDKLKIVNLKEKIGIVKKVLKQGGDSGTL